MQVCDAKNHLSGGCPEALENRLHLLPDKQPDTRRTLGLFSAQKQTRKSVRLIVRCCPVGLKVRLSVRRRVPRTRQPDSTGRTATKSEAT
jgi:hypothetical protein